MTKVTELLSPCNALEAKLAQRIFFVAAGPDRQLGKLAGQVSGQELHREPFAGEVPGQSQGHPVGFGRQTCVESCFAGHQDLRHRPPCARRSALGSNSLTETSVV